MRQALYGLVALGLVAPALPAAASPRISVSTSPIILGRVGSVTLEISDLPGSGAPRGEANVGSVEQVEEVDGVVRVRYIPPQTRSPQVLGLALWRGDGIDAQVHFFRVPLYGQSKVPVRTRKNSMVRVIVGGKVYGPVNTGSGGRAHVTVLVPPGVRQAGVEVTDRANLKSRKRIAITQPPYNELSMVINTSGTSSSLPRFRVTLGTTEGGPAPRVQVGADRLQVERLKTGGWTGLWAPSRRPPEGTIAIRAWIPGRPRSQRLAEMGISPVSFSVNIVRVQARGTLVVRSKLRGQIGVLVGMQHNLGEILSPRFAVDLGLDYPLGPGRIGLRLFAGFSWASQRLPAVDGLGPGDSSVALIPIGGGLTYKLALGPVTPYLLVGCLAQIVRTSNNADYTQESLRHDVAVGALGLIGGDLQLGPGRVLLQAGYQWSRIDNEELKLQAGGLVVEGGYRLDL